MIQSRERAKALIMAGVVFVNEQKVDKAGEMIKEDAKVEVRGHDIGYVSRGGLKLEKAMQCFPLTPNGKVCMDIGASTGGFTDCMLQNGAVKVYAVDVGYGQLAWSLRTDERVVNMERTNIRNVTLDMLAEPIEFFQRRCVVYLAASYLPGGAGHHDARRNGRLPRQASVRGWPREGG